MSTSNGRVIRNATALARTAALITGGTDKGRGNVVIQDDRVTIYLTTGGRIQATLVKEFSPLDDSPWEK